MSAVQEYCVLDYETFSESDLEDDGAYEYAVHPSTEILCVAWRRGTRKQLREKSTKTRLWADRLKNSEERLAELIAILKDPRIIIVAHNSFFESCVTKFVLSRYVSSKQIKELLRAIEFRRFICTAALAAVYALPRKLEQVGKVLELSVQKDMEGNKLIKKWCKPRKPTKKNPSTRHNDPDEFRKICLYCVRDIDTEVEAFLKLPPLNPIERQVWLLDQKINMRGMLVDRDMVKTILDMVSVEVPRLNEICQRITKGQVAGGNAREAMLNYLNKLGADLPDMRKKTLEDFLIDPKNQKNKHFAHIAQVIDIRQKTAKTSTAKYVAFERRTRSDGRCRDNLLYHAASTGRWGGRGVQPQNFPRGSLHKDADTNLATDVIKTGNLEWIRTLYGSPMDVFSTCLRNAITASEGKELFVADYAGIEARVLFWLAGHEKGLDIFRNGEDIYKYMASAIFQIPVSEVDKTLHRPLGKEGILGCGYQMGWKKFKDSAADKGLYISAQLAKKTVDTYREEHKPVKQLWYNIEKAAIEAVQRPGRRVKVNKVSFYMAEGFLVCELPSGRTLNYHKPAIKMEIPPWEKNKKNPEKQPKLYHWGIHPKTKQWVFDSTYGGKLVENIVQAIARDLMAEAMLRIDRAGFEIILSVHDELVSEAKLGKFSLEYYNKLMSTLPPWATGCPVEVEGWTGYRYRK